MDDEETGLYYLRSRYYNSELGRFVNADSILGTVGSLGNRNAYVYCENIITTLHDPDGDTPENAHTALRPMYSLGSLAEAGGGVIVLFAAGNGLTDLVQDLIDSVGQLWITVCTFFSATTATTTSAATTNVILSGPYSETCIAVQAQVAAMAATSKAYEIQGITIRQEMKKVFRYSFHVHHIVPRFVPSALQARAILNKVLYPLGVEDSRNLVVLPAQAHLAMHTGAYGLYVNERIKAAYQKGSSPAEQYAYVVLELDLLRLELLGASMLSY